MSLTVSCPPMAGTVPLTGASRHLYHDSLESTGKGVSLGEDACRAYDDDHPIYRPNMADV